MFPRKRPLRESNTRKRSHTLNQTQHIHLHNPDRIFIPLHPHQNRSQSTIGSNQLKLMPESHALDGDDEGKSCLLASTSRITFGMKFHTGWMPEHVFTSGRMIMQRTPYKSQWPLQSPLNCLATWLLAPVLSQIQITAN